MIISSHELVMSTSHTVQETSHETTNYNQCNRKVVYMITFLVVLIEEFSYNKSVRNQLALVSAKLSS